MEGDACKLTSYRRIIENPHGGLLPDKDHFYQIGLLTDYDTFVSTRDTADPKTLKGLFNTVTVKWLLSSEHLVLEKNTDAYRRREEFRQLWRQLCTFSTTDDCTRLNTLQLQEKKSRRQDSKIRNLIDNYLDLNIRQVTVGETLTKVIAELKRLNETDEDIKKNKDVKALRRQESSLLAKIESVKKAIKFAEIEFGLDKNVIMVSLENICTHRKEIRKAEAAADVIADGTYVIAADPIEITTKKKAMRDKLADLEQLTNTANQDRANFLTAQASCRKQQQRTEWVSRFIRWDKQGQTPEMGALNFPVVQLSANARVRRWVTLFDSIFGVTVVCKHGRMLVTKLQNINKFNRLLTWSAVFTLNAGFASAQSDTRKTCNACPGADSGSYLVALRRLFGYDLHGFFPSTSEAIGNKATTAETALALAKIEKFVICMMFDSSQMNVDEAKTACSELIAQGSTLHAFNLIFRVWHKSVSLKDKRHYPVQLPTVTLADVHTGQLFDPLDIVAFPLVTFAQVCEALDQVKNIRESMRVACFSHVYDGNTDEIFPNLAYELLVDPDLCLWAISSTLDQYGRMERKRTNGDYRPLVLLLENRQSLLPAACMGSQSVMLRMMEPRRPFSKSGNYLSYRSNFTSGHVVFSQTYTEQFLNLKRREIVLDVHYLRPFSDDKIQTLYSIAKQALRLAELNTNHKHFTSIKTAMTRHEIPTPLDLSKFTKRDSYRFFRFFYKLDHRTSSQWTAFLREHVAHEDVYILLAILFLNHDKMATYLKHINTTKQRTTLGSLQQTRSLFKDMT